MTTIGKWRYINQKELERRIAAIPLNNGEERQEQMVHGLGGTDANGKPSRDTAWRQKVQRATVRHPGLSEQQVKEEFERLQIDQDTQAADNQLEEAQRIAEGRNV